MATPNEGQLPLPSVQLERHKGLASATICDFERLTVLCGKNSSGKSTVLESIQKFVQDGQRKQPPPPRATSTLLVGLANQLKNHRLSKRPFTQEDLDRMINVLRQRHSDSTVMEKSIITDMLAAWQQNAPLDLRFGAGANDVALEYVKRFQSVPKGVVLIPPKRTLETEGAINPTAEVLPSGSNLIQFCFRARNEQSGSPAAKLLTILKKEFETISGGYTFDTLLDENHQNEIRLKFSRAGGGWVDARDTGLGLQDLLIMIYFALESKSELILIEEPESHLHPEAQRHLLAFFAERTAKQIILATHSNIFINSFVVGKVLKVSYNAEVSVEDATNRALLLTELGYDVTDNLVSDLIILVEGPSDVPVVSAFLSKMGLLSEYNIKLWPLGGDIMDQADLEVFTQGYKVMALVDKDPGSAKIRNRFIANCRAAKVRVTQLDRYSLENFFTVEALRAVFGPQFPARINHIDPMVKLESQIGIDVKKNNHKIVSHMSLQDIAGTSLDRFLKAVERTLQS